MNNNETCHIFPCLDNVDIFVTACSDGQILLYDIRDSSSSDDQLTLAVSMQPFHSVAFNPIEPRLVITGRFPRTLLSPVRWDLTEVISTTYTFR